MAGYIASGKVTVCEPGPDIIAAVRNFKDKTGLTPGMVRENTVMGRIFRIIKTCAKCGKPILEQIYPVTDEPAPTTYSVVNGNYYCEECMR